MISRRQLLGTGFAAAALAAMPRQVWAQDRIKPAFKLFDTHGHFYTFERDQYPFHFGWGRGDNSAIIQRAQDHPMRPVDIFKVWDEAGVAKGLGVQYNTTYGTDNRYLLDMAERHPDRILPVVILNPVEPSTPLALEMMAKHSKIVGVRFAGPINAEAGRFPFLDDPARGAWEVANDLGLTITLMPLGNVPAAMNQVGEFAQAYPNVHIVLDHIGWPTPVPSKPFGLTPEHLALAGRPNIFYKFTSWLIIPMQQAGVPLNEFVEFAVETYGADHMIWGTDIGNTPGDIVEWTQIALRSAQGLSPDRQKAMFWDTAERIFVPGGRGNGG